MRLLVYVVYSGIIGSACAATIKAWHLHQGKEAAVVLFAISLFLLGILTVSKDDER